VALKTALLKRSRDMVAMSFVLAQLGMRKERMLMGEYFFVSSTEITMRFRLQ
jgi:hypothetical protein